MNSLSFANVKLKKTEGIVDKSAPKVTGFISDEEVQKYQSQVLDINFECWVNELSDVTFTSFLFPVTIEQAEELIRAYNNPDFSIAESPITQDLINKLQAFLDQNLEENAKFFAKMSSRSAKDAPAHSIKTKQIYKDCLTNLIGENPEIRNSEEKLLNAQIHSLLTAGTLSLQMENARQVIDLFIKSERINQDLTLAIEHKDRFQENIVIRKWVTIDVDMEFRAFVCNNKLNAISQYNYVCHFPRLEKMKGELENRINEFFSNVVHPRLASKFSSYVIDFAVTGENYDKLYVIELNPFLSSTDSSLFSWKTDEDILRNGPYEFRINTGQVPPLRAISLDWREIITSCPPV